jgi:hypothetical protein
MSQKILLQTILRLQDEIKTGAANFMDVSAAYLRDSGDFLDGSLKNVALEEINKLAPSNVASFPTTSGQGIMSKYTNATDDIPAGEQDAMMEKFLQGADRTYAKFVDDALIDLQKASPSEQKEMIKSIIGRKGTFRYLDTADAKKLLDSVDNPIDSTSLKDNLMQTDNPFSDLVKTTEKGPKTLVQRRADAIKELGLDKGVGSLYPKGEPGEIFDTANSKRYEMAAFMKAMRGAGIKNEDVMNTAKITDVAEGKRAATTLARAADMGADTKIKQEFLSDLDEKVMNNGPRYFQEEFQGYDSYGELIQTETSRIRNAVVDDLEALGVDEQKLTNILTYSNDVAKKNPYQPEAFIESIKQELEMNNIKYDMSFWENYISKILELSSKTEPRFADGGLV